MNEQWRRDHDLFGGHAREADDDGERKPETRVRRGLDRTRECVKREQVTQPDERFRALHDVSDRLGLKRMQYPNYGYKGREQVVVVRR